MQEFEIEFEIKPSEYEIDFEIKPSEYEIDISNVIKEIKPTLVNLEVEPTKEKQVFKHDGEYGYDEVIVEKIPDEYVIPTGTIDINKNGLSNVSGYENANVDVKPILQEKTIIPSKELQEVIADENYDGLSKVNVNAIPNEYIVPSGTIDIVTSGEYNVSQYEKANVEIQAGDEWKDVFISSIDNSSGANVKKLPDELTSIGYYAFAYCENLNLEELPSGLKIIAGYAFRSCTSLDLEELPDSVETIGSTAFRGCTALALKKLPKNLKTMGTYAFSECDNLAITEIPDGVTLLDQYLFYESTGLTKMTLHENIQTFNQRVFYNCTNLKEVDVKTTKINSLAGYTFYNCSSLEKLIIRKTTPPTITTSTFTNSGIAKKTGYIYVPDESVSAYQKATNWATYASQIRPLSELEG